MGNKVDDKLDGVIIIDAGGIILMANKVGVHAATGSICRFPDGSWCHHAPDALQP